MPYLKPQSFLGQDILSFKDLTTDESYPISFDKSGNFERISPIVLSLISENRAEISASLDFLGKTIKRPENGGIIHLCNVLEVNITGKGGGVNPGIKGISSYLFRQGPMLSARDALIIGKDTVPKAKENLRYLEEKGLVVVRDENVFGVDIDENSTRLSHRGEEELRDLIKDREAVFKFLPFIHTEKTKAISEKMGFDYTANIDATKLLTDKFYILNELQNFSVKTIYGIEIQNANMLLDALKDPRLISQELLVLKLRDGASGLGVRFVRNNYSEILRSLIELGEASEDGSLKYPVRIEEYLKTISSPSAGLYISNNEIIFLGFSDQFFEKSKDGFSPPKEHMGNIGPANYEDLIKTVSVQVGEFARRLNYTGFLGIDFLLVENAEKEVELRVAEINPRLGGPSTAYRIACDHPLAKERGMSFARTGFAGGNLDIAREHRSKTIYQLDKELSKILQKTSKSTIGIISNILPINFGRIQVTILGENPEVVRSSYRKAQDYFSPNHNSNL